MEWTIRQEEDLQAVASALLTGFADRFIFAFQGEIGAGKTTLIKAICSHLGVFEAEVTSPTFALVNEYSYQDAQTKQQSRIFHLDLYRLKHIEEALGIGIEEYLSGAHYCFVEWPEIINPLLPEDVVYISIDVLDNANRRIIAE